MSDRYSQFFDFAQTLIECSSPIICASFLDPSLAIDQKPDRSLVTKADRDAESALREKINATFPDHGIIGEEWGTERENAEFVWTVDPIDGTISFATGVPLFGTLIGLLHKGEPVLGLIHQPILRQLCIGTDEGTFLNGRQVRVRERELESATLLLTDTRATARYQRAEPFDRLLSKVKVARTWGDCYGYLLVASGMADLMCDPVMHPWDSAPLGPLIRGAGGTCTDWSGAESRRILKSVIAGSQSAHRAAMEILTH